MRILGLSSFTHDGAAVVLEDGAVKAAIENDKIARQSTRGLPEAAIRSCLETAETEWNSLDLIAVATQPLRAWGRKSLLRAKLSFAAPLASAYYGATEIGSQARQLNDLRRLRQRAAPGNIKVVAHNHHLCHAANAFYLSPFDRAVVSDCRRRRRWHIDDASDRGRREHSSITQHSLSSLPRLGLFAGYRPGWIRSAPGRT